MTQHRHWTEEGADAFAHRIAFDFIAQIEDQMDALPMTQADLAAKLGVSEGAVSKLLNNPQNLTLRTIAKYSRAVRMKASIVAYDDGDQANQTGPINSEVFRVCWERAGRPHDQWSLEYIELQRGVTNDAILGTLRLSGYTFSSITVPIGDLDMYGQSHSAQSTSGILNLTGPVAPMGVDTHA